MGKTYESCRRLDARSRYGLRRSAASLAVSAGANVETVSRSLGHAGAAVTLDVYSDLFNDELEAVADRLN